MIHRRRFIRLMLTGMAGLLNFRIFPEKATEYIMTVNGPLHADNLGVTLTHEHILVDFIGAEKIDSSRWNHEAVIEKILPLLLEAKREGCQSFVDCTPNFLGRDVALLKRLSELSGLNILTNTGYYGGSDHRYLPSHAFSESPHDLAQRWIKEFEYGIDGTNIRPGFIKISVNDDQLSEVSTRLIQGAALTHLATGLTIASHTGNWIPAYEQIQILKKEGVHPNAFVWVHAQNEKNWNNYLKAKKEGAWISLDGVSENNIDQYTEMVAFMKKERALGHLLLSHDAGWYDPAKPEGGMIRGYTTMFTQLIPSLKRLGLNKKDLDRLLSVNPKNAFSIKKRSLKKSD
jgi:phosphotriesterase-related protein